MALSSLQTSETVASLNIRTSVRTCLPKSSIGSMGRASNWHMEIAGSNSALDCL